MKRSLANLVVVALVLAAASVSRMRRAFRRRPITIVVPYGAGRPADILARILCGADAWPARSAGDRPSRDSGRRRHHLGVSRVVRAAPDGYTLSYGNWGTHV